MHGQVPSYDRSLTPLLPSDAADPSVCYVPNAYQQPFYYGSSFIPKHLYDLQSLLNCHECLTSFSLFLKKIFFKDMERVVKIGASSLDTTLISRVWT